jgi:hypothetical protein
MIIFTDIVRKKYDFSKVESCNVTSIATTATTTKSTRRTSTTARWEGQEIDMMMGTSLFPFFVCEAQLNMWWKIVVYVEQ